MSQKVLFDADTNTSAMRCTLCGMMLFSFISCRAHVHSCPNKEQDADATSNVQQAEQSSSSAYEQLEKEHSTGGQ